MISVHNITSIAKYEITTLLRSWFFRIFAILAMIFVFFFNMGMLIFANGGTGNWAMKAIPSVIPYVNLLLINTVQAIIAIFLASDFLKRDKKLDTTDVIYIRSMSNGEYVAGKTIGNIVVFMILNLLILTEALIFNMISEDVTVEWMAYLYYFVIISLPTLVFIMGLSFFVMSVIKNQAITFILLLGYVAVTIFYLNTKFYFLFDYMAYSIPLLNSDFIGFGNLTTILIHRGMYASFGVAFIFLTVSLLKRLPQSPFSNKVTLIPALIFFAAGIWLGYKHISTFTNSQELRSEIRLANDASMSLPRLKVESYQIAINHLGNKLDVSAKVKVRNTHAETVKDFVFTLNPGFKLNKVSFNGQETTIKRNQNIIEFNGTNLEPDETAELEFNYAGKPNEAACFLDMADTTLQKANKFFMFQIDKRYAIVTPESVVLTRESNWYPVSGTGFGNESKQWIQKQFSSFDVSVKTKPGLVAISQGRSELKDGTFTFTNKRDLSQISLVIGDYAEKTDTIDGLVFSFYYQPTHDYFSKFLEPIKDTIPDLIAEALKDYERKLDLFYPFDRFNLVEVPAQFYSYQRTLIGTREQVQPETIFFPEKGLQINDADFNGRIKMMEKFGHGDETNSTPEEKKIMAFNNFLSLFTRTTSFEFNRSPGGGGQPPKMNENPLYAFPLFYNYAYYVASDKWPVTDRIFESYLQQSSSSGMMGFMSSMQGMSENEEANLALQDNSFAELLNDPEKIKIIDNVILQKSQSLFSLIKRKTGDDAFDDFMFEFLKSMKFKGTTIGDFNTRIKTQFDTDLIPYMDTWFNSKKLPGYLFGSISAVNVLDVDQLKTMVKFKVTNTEPVEGIIIAQFRVGRGGGPGRGSSSGETIDKLISIDGNQTKEVSFLLEGSPRGVSINTLTSRNIPSVIRMSFENIEEDTKATPFEGEKIVDVPVKIAEDNEIICDDEDPGFSIPKSSDSSPLQRLLLGEEQTKQKYIGFSTRHAPRTWRATTNSSFFGRYVRSAHYTRGGDGSQRATWKMAIPGPGFYEVYTYYAKSRDYRGRDSKPASGDYTYTIEQSGGSDEVVMDLKDMTAGWNSLGTFNLSGDTIKISLSNKSTAEVVVADAIKLVSDKYDRPKPKPKIKKEIKETDPEKEPEKITEKPKKANKTEKVDTKEKIVNKERKKNKI